MNNIICYCKNISKQEIEKSINNGAKTLKYIQTMTTACTGNKCKELNPSGKCCSEDIKAILNSKNTHNNSNSCSCC